jgi:hypothetical protein
MNTENGLCFRLRNRQQQEQYVKFCDHYLLVGSCQKKSSVTMSLLSPFKSVAFTAFPHNNGIYPHSYTVYHPVSNGAAECMVCNLQSIFLKQALDEDMSQHSLQHKVDAFLLAQQNMYTIYAKLTPAELFLGHKPHISFHPHHPSTTKKEEIHATEEMAEISYGTKISDQMWISTFKDRDLKWKKEVTSHQVSRELI